MSVAHRPLFSFAESDFLELEELYVPWQATPAPAPELVVLNDDLAIELGADPVALRGPEGLSILAGNEAPEGTTPVAQVYAGHQFGGYSPRLGDGRALLLGEVRDVHGRRRDLHMKGSGPTPFARGGDGKAALGPMLREYVIGEAMHALGIPTSRALAVVTTGDRIVRDAVVPGAVLVRVAASHLRVGTFQYAANHPEPSVLRRLADHAIARHAPHLVGTERPVLSFFETVLEAQAQLVAGWMSVGFIHGVMNTDNMAISGETIDYGPCAFMDRYDPDTVFSSIDLGGRYAFGNQPRIAHWNLARLAEALLPLVDAEVDDVVEALNDVLGSFAGRYEAAWRARMRTKLGIAANAAADDALVDELLALLESQRVDYTSSFRVLSSHLHGDAERGRSLFDDPAPYDAWVERWQRVAVGGRDADAVADAMDRVNPVYVPRNHLVEEALSAATGGDLDPLRRLVDAVTDPFHERDGLERYAEPAPPDFGPYRTYCGT